MKITLNKFIVLSIFLLFFISKNILAIEEPDYKVLKEYEEFEIREYVSYIVAEVEIDSTFEEASNKAFQILFQYISGNNVKQEEIEMTAPVNQMNSNKGEEIEMTVPVTQKSNLKSDGTYMVSFVLPSKYNLESAPLPKDQRISIREIPEKLMAVREYSGTWSEENYRENEKLLIDELNKNKLKIIGEPVYARYNPPFWPWFLRRNEVMVEIEFFKAE